MIESTLKSVLQPLGLDGYITPEALEKFKFLYSALVSVNSEMNLTAITEEDKVAALHFADSITAAPYIPEGASVIDVGCGGGFPCLPLAIVRPDLKITALDSTAKKLTFVDSVAIRLSLNVTTLPIRAEEGARKEELRESFDFALSRAVARMNILSELCLPYVKVGGTFAALKGRDALVEFEEAKNGVKLLGARAEKPEMFELTKGIESTSRGIIICEKISNTPEKYPRQYAKIKKNPL